jgi:hypothetical protein
MSVGASATTSTAAGQAVSAILQSGNNLVTYVAQYPAPIPYTTTWPTALLKTGQLISDSQGNIAPNVTITAVTAGNNTITLSAPAIGSTVTTPLLSGTAPLVSFTGTVVVSYEIISSVPAAAFTPTPAPSSGNPTPAPYLSPGAAIAGPNIPAGTVVTAVSPSAGTVTISQFPTAGAGPEVVGAPLSILGTTILTPITLQSIRVDTAVANQGLTLPAVEFVTPSLGTATLSQPVTGFTGTNTLIVEGTDIQDVEPYDAGAATPAISPSGGPVPIPGTSPAVYGGFFDTAGSATSSSTNPPGSTFARTFSQVLAALYGNAAPQAFEGGFFPNGVAGGINFV